MAQRTLNERQMEVLRWIERGCKPEEMREPSFKTTAVALQNRRLVTIKRTRDSWTAQVTPAGRHFLDAGQYPDGHWATDSGLRSRLPGNKPRPVTAQRPTDALLAKLLKDGAVPVHPDDRSYHDILVASINRHGKAPAGRQVIGVYERGQYVIRLIEAPAVQRVPVPEVTPARLHRAVKAAVGDHPKYKPPVLRRVRAILNAIALESLDRGWRVSSDGRDLVIAEGRHEFRLWVKEQVARRDFELTEAQRRRINAGGYVRTYVYEGTGVLGLVSPQITWQMRAKDKGRSKVEDQLPKLFSLMNSFFATSRMRDEARVRAAEEAERVWRNVRARAVDLAQEAARSKVLTDQAARWRQASELRAYLAAAREHLALIEDSREAADATTWIEWGERFAASRDPLSGPLAVPASTDPTAAELKPFMEGMSPDHPPSTLRF